MTTTGPRPRGLSIESQLNPDYPVGVVLLAHLAVATDHQGQQLGAKTLVTALRKAVELTTIGLPALGQILDVIDEDALGVYRNFDLFGPFNDDPMRVERGGTAGDLYK